MAEPLTLTEVYRFFERLAVETPSADLRAMLEQAENDYPLVMARRLAEVALLRATERCHQDDAPPVEPPPVEPPPEPEPDPPPQPDPGPVTPGGNLYEPFRLSQDRYRDPGVPWRVAAAGKVLFPDWHADWISGKPYPEPTDVEFPAYYNLADAPFLTEPKQQHPNRDTNHHGEWASWGERFQEVKLENAAGWVGLRPVEHVQAQGIALKASAAFVPFVFKSGGNTYAVNDPGQHMGANAGPNWMFFMQYRLAMLDGAFNVVAASRWHTGLDVKAQTGRDSFYTAPGEEIRISFEWTPPGLGPVLARLEMMAPFPLPTVSVWVREFLLVE